MEMKTHLLLLIVGLALAFVLMRTVNTPHLMISPGAPIQAHEEIATDCFACHTPFHGVTADKCIDCHKVEEIGLVTTKGVSIAKEKKNVRFHQQLVESDCVACHSDHKGVQPFRPISRFSHKLLDPELQKQCDSCHSKPKDSLHRKLKANCSQCHNQNDWKAADFSHKTLEPAVLKQCDSCHDVPDDRKHRKFSTINCATCHGYEAWEPAIFKHDKLPTTELAQCLNCHSKPDDKRHSRFEKNCDSCHGYNDWDEVDFKHSKLPPEELKQCQSCHESPRDSLHRSTKMACGECHSQEEWKPATFKHDKYFRFDRHHRTECETCHQNNDYSQYTCYGCHEHSRSKIRSEHLEEGIRDYEECSECHRSGDEHEAERIWRSKRYGGESFNGISREREWGEHEDDDDD